MRFLGKDLIQFQKLEEVFIEKEIQQPIKVVLKEALVEQETTLVVLFSEVNSKRSLL